MRTVEPAKWPKNVRLRQLHARSWLQDPRDSGVEMRLRGCLRDAVAEYRQHCSVNGLRQLVNPALPWGERWQRGVVWGVVVCYAAWAAWERSSVLHGAPAQLVALLPAARPVRLIPFPAVALCSNNVIMREQLDRVTDMVRQRLNSSESWRATRARLRQLGALLTRDLPAADIAYLQNIEQSVPYYNVTNFMAKLSPECSALLRRCSWRGRTTPCEQLFALRLTPLGFCCVFNSRYYKEDEHRQPKYLDLVGHGYGLNVVVKQDPRNFGFLRRASAGIDVLLFDGSEYPILEGGGVRMYPMDQNISAIMRLSATVQQPAGSVSECAPRKVGGARAERGYAWCLAECRRRTLVAVCGCRHYTLLPDEEDDVHVCSLIDLPCLNKHREKFSYYYPDGYTTPALEEEIQNGQLCEECAPDCSRYVYSAAVSFTRPRVSYHRKIWRRMTTNISMVNATVIRMFYRSGHQQVASIETSKRWYESVATVSCLWAQMTGATVVPALEAGFFLLVRSVHHYRRRTRLARLRQATAVSTTRSCS